MVKKLEIQNSTVEFLVFIAEGKEDDIQVLYKDETIWATQKAMAQLFDCSTDNIGLHLKNIFLLGELIKEEGVSKLKATNNLSFRTNVRNLEYIHINALRDSSLRSE